MGRQDSRQCGSRVDRGVDGFFIFAALAVTAAASWLAVRFHRNASPVSS
jgi:hypothetical protein